MRESQKEKIKELIGKGETSAAISLLKEFISNPDYNNELLDLSGRYENLKDNVRRNLINDQDSSVELSRINKSLLELVDLETTVKNSIKKDRVSSRFGKAIVVLFVLVLFYSLLSFFLKNYERDRVSTTRGSVHEIDEVNTNRAEELVSGNRGPLPQTPILSENQFDPVKMDTEDDFLINEDTYFRIGEVYWMRKNLSNSVSSYWGSCYKGIGSYCEKYGGLYSWSRAKIACSELGGRLPSDKEWKALFEKYDSGYYDIHNNEEIGNNSQQLFSIFLIRGISKMDIVFGGLQDANGIFDELGTSGYYWSETKSNVGNKHSYFIFDGNSKQVKRNQGKEVLLSCRCVFDRKNIKK